MSRNLIASIRSVDSLLGHHDLVASESEKISSRPSRDDLDDYLAAMDRVSTAYQAMKQASAEQYGPTLQNMVGLLETGAANLIALFAEILTQSSRRFQAGVLYDEGQPFPTLSTEYFAQGIAILNFLRTLPDVGLAHAEKAELLYAEVRSNVLSQSLEDSQQDALLIISLGADGETKGLGRLVDVTVSLLKAEYGIAATALGDTSPGARRVVLASIASKLAQAVATTGQTLNGKLKRSLTSLAAIAFHLFGELQERQPEFDEWFRSKCSRKENELGDLAHAFRGTCLTSLPEKVQEIRSWGSKVSNVAESASSLVSPVCVATIDFMRSLCDRANVVEPLLKTLGASNWGSSSQKEGGLLSIYLDDLTTALVDAIERRSQALKQYRTAISAVFMLNNLSYIRREIMSTQIGDVLGEEWEDQLNKQVRTAKASYLDIWSPLVAALMEPGSEQSGPTSALKAGLHAVAGNAEKKDKRDRFLRFNEALAEVESLHANVAKLDPGEGELRDRLRIEVQRMVCPTYQKFAARSLEGPKQPSKYQRLDAEQLASKINAIFSD